MPMGLLRVGPFGKVSSEDWGRRLRLVRSRGCAPASAVVLGEAGGACRCCCLSEAWGLPFLCAVDAVVRRVDRPG